MIDRAGIFDKIPAADYHADPCPEPSLSASIAKILSAQSPLHAWAAHPRLNPDYEPQEDARFDRGSAAHALLLEGEDRMAVIDAKDYRKADAQEARDAARAAGKHPILKADYPAVYEMVEVAVKAIAECPDLGGRTLADGRAEQTLIAREGPVWLRSRTDWLANDRTMTWDYKTTTDASPAAFSRQIARMGYHIQNAFYERMVKALADETPAFILIAQEVDPPFAVSFHGVAPSLLEIGRYEVERAVRTWAKCMESGTWPGYLQRIHWAEAAAWQSMEHEERLALGIPYEIEQLWEKMK